MANRTKLTANVRATILAQLAAGYSMDAAARAAGVARQSVWQWRQEDPEFHAAFEQAYEQGTDVFEDEARRRAVEGTDKPIYQRGECVGTVREFSDGLLTLLLKARRPEAYRERQDVQLGVTGEVAVRYVNDWRDQHA